MNNLIPCTQQCKYQIEGYCNLQEVVAVVSLNNRNCIYFSPQQNTKAKQTPNTPTM